MYSYLFFIYFFFHLTIFKNKKTRLLISKNINKLNKLIMTRGLFILILKFLTNIRLFHLGFATALLPGACLVEQARAFFPIRSHFALSLALICLDGAGKCVCFPRAQAVLPSFAVAALLTSWLHGRSSSPRGQHLFIAHLPPPSYVLERVLCFVARLEKRMHN